MQTLTQYPWRCIGLCEEIKKPDTSGRVFIALFIALITGI